MFRWIDRFFARYAIENLTLYVLIATAAGSAYVILTNDTLGLITYEAIFQRGQLWHLAFFPFRVDMGSLFGSQWLALLLFCYIFWLFASQLEAQMGAPGFNKFLFLGYLLILGGALFAAAIARWMGLPDAAINGIVSAYYIDLAVLVAVAYLNPNQEILLFFVLPVRLKIVAWILVGFVVASALMGALATGNPLYLMGPLCGFGNVLLVFGPEMLRRVRRRTGSEVRRARQAVAAPSALHRCTVCGRTEHDDAALEFRFCNECSDHEYCMEHLRDHEHIQ